MGYHDAIAHHPERARAKLTREWSPPMAAVPDYSDTFETDLVNACRETLNRLQFSVDDTWTLDQWLLASINGTRRSIPTQPRQVSTSVELRKSEAFGRHASAIARLAGMATLGRPLRPYLSKRMRQPLYQDRLLNDWGIVHFHLGAHPHSRARFSARTGDLLYCAVTPSALLMLLVLDHAPVSSFANQQLVEVLHSNWPHVIARYKVTGQPTWEVPRLGPGDLGAGGQDGRTQDHGRTRSTGGAGQHRAHRAGTGGLVPGAGHRRTLIGRMARGTGRARISVAGGWVRRARPAEAA